MEQGAARDSRNIKHGHKLVESTRTSIESDPLMADLIEFA